MLPSWFAERHLRSAHTIDDLRTTARKSLPRMVFDYLDGGALSESTMSRNRTAFQRYRLIPRAPFDVGARDSSVTLFGQTLGFPLIVGPTGYASAFWPKGDLALVRSAAKAGVIFVTSNGANSSLEDIAAAANGDTWLQVYVAHNKEQTLSLVRLAKSLGFKGLQVTVDTALPGRRLRDVRNGFSVPYSWNARKLFDVARRPGWALRALPYGAPRPGLIDTGARHDWATVSEFVRSQINPRVSWDDLKWLRDHWQGPLVVKGLMDAKQMPEAIAAGYDGVVVSNHGGRQLDGAISTLEVLPEFREATAGRIPILIDSGIRSGTDILKALVLGASAVQVGRATLYGLSTAGEAGVDHALAILRTEFDMAMALTGLTSVSQAEPGLVRLTP